MSVFLYQWFSLEIYVRGFYCAVYQVTNSLVNLKFYIQLVRHLTNSNFKYKIIIELLLIFTKNTKTWSFEILHSQLNLLFPHDNLADKSWNYSPSIPSYFFWKIYFFQKYFVTFCPEAHKVVKTLIVENFIFNLC